MSTQPHRYNVRLELIPDWASTVAAAITGIAQHALITPEELTPGSKPAAERSVPSASEIHASQKRGIDALMAALAPYPQAFNAVRDCLNQMFEVTPEGIRSRQR